MYLPYESHITPYNTVPMCSLCYTLTVNRHIYNRNRGLTMEYQSFVIRRMGGTLTEVSIPFSLL